MEAAAERIGRFEFALAHCEPTPEFKARWDQRAESLAAWLLAEWEAEHVEEEHADACAAG